MVLGDRVGMVLGTGLQVGMLFGTAMIKWVTHSFGEWQVHREFSLCYWFYVLAWQWTDLSIAL